MFQIGVCGLRNVILLVVFTEGLGCWPDLVRSSSIRKGMIIVAVTSIIVHFSNVQVHKLSMVGTNGGKFPAIRQHLERNIAAVYKDMDTS